MPNRSVRPHDVSLVENGTIVTPYKVIESGSVLIEKGKIAEVKERRAKASTRRGSPNELDATSKIIIPGMIDIHTHGLEGGSSLEGNAGLIRKMATSFPRHGVTAFLPTTGAEPHQLLLSTAKIVAELVKRGASDGGAEVLGLNLEGPYISKAKPGAQPLNFVKDPDVDEFNRLYNASGGTARLITVAPELPGALEFIATVKAKGVTVAAGHSNATYEQMLAGIDAGITHASHTYNAMREFKHRDPGMLAAILSREDVTAELIADNVHVHEGAMKLLIKAKGVERVVLISDSMPFTGFPDGTYDIMGFRVDLKNGISTLPTGQIAGSTITLDRSLCIVTIKLGIALQDAVRMATVNPARVIKVDQRKGSIEKGKDADLALLNKEDLSVYATIIKGKLVYRRSVDN